jgi:Tol biopolymer transport system component
VAAPRRADILRVNPASGALAAALADRYRIERELGAGGMATVYLAHDVRHDRKVALKVLRPELSAILGGERFLAEIKTTANLQHPHILGLFDSGEAAGLVYYVMPFVEGESLRDRLNRDHQLPVEEAIRLAREVADALQYAHEHGVVHRDIKPENILLHGGHAVVADFGIALAASRSDGGARMTETGMSLGTPHYMSPEQAMGEREVTPKADIYALGCVLYEMLTAEPPFTGANAQAIIGRVLTEEPRSLTAQRRTIPPNVEAAVRMALAKLPADRFESAKEFSAALVKSDFVTAGTRAVAAAAPSAVARATLRQRVLRAVPWALALAGLATSASLVASRPDPVVTRQRTLLWSRPLNPGAFGRNAAISPDGNTIVFTDTVGGVRQLWTKARNQVDATPLAGTITPSGMMGPTFSPDGEWIAFVADGKLKRVPRHGGSAIIVADSANPTDPAIAWLDDGTILFNNPAYSLNAINVNGSQPRRVVDVVTLQRGAVFVSPLPKGRGALFIGCTGGCGTSDLYVLDLQTDSVRSLTTEVLRAWHVPGGDVIFARRDGGVFKAAFDVNKLEFSAAPVPVLNGVQTLGSTADITLSPGGTLLYVAGAAGAGSQHVEPIWVTREGATSVIDPSFSYAVSANSGLALSPDGTRLAVSVASAGGSDIWVKELPAGPFTRLTFESNNSRPSWTADGRTILYVSSVPPAPARVVARRADGTGVETTLYTGTQGAAEVIPTRDTSRFVVRTAGPPTRDIYLLDRSGDSARFTPLVANGGYEEAQPALSPDNRWLAYASNETGRYEVYVRPFPDANSGRWQVSRNGGLAPGWSRDGRSLLYRDGNNSMVQAEVRPGNSFVLGEQRTLFPVTGRTAPTTPLWALTRDETRFIFIRTLGLTIGASEVPVEVIQVDNWLHELRSGGARLP